MSNLPFIRSSIVKLIVLASASGILAEDLPSSLFERGLYLEEYRQDYDAALSAYQKVLEDEEADPELRLQARFRAATCHLKDGNREAAVALLNEVLLNLPEADALSDPSRRVTIDHTFAEILDRALPELDRSDLLSAAFEGLASTLGDTADYFDSRELEDLRVNVAGRLVGIGAILAEEEGRFQISGVIAGGPAEEAGLASGDEILEVDGKKTGELAGLQELVSVIRGREGSTVQIRIRSRSDDDERALELTRREISLETRVVSAIHDRWFADDANDVGTLRITNFPQNCADAVGTKINELVRQGMKAMVLDLRGNGGGVLSAGVETADLFLDDGVIVTVEARNRPAQQHLATPDRPFGFPVAILIDRHTASAAEIVAAALQYHGRAVVVGERSHGKGTVETIIGVPGGGAIKLPISRFVTPSGRSLHRLAGSEDWGVNPDPGYEMASVRPNQSGSEAERIALDSALRKAIDWCRAQLGK